VKDLLETSLREIADSKPGELSGARYMALARQLSDVESDLAPIRLVMLSTFTTDLLSPFLKVEGARYGLAIEVYGGGFGQLEQALLGRDDWAATGDEHAALVVSIRLEDLDPDVAFRFYAGEDSFSDLAEHALERLENTVRIFRERCSGPVLVANFATPEYQPLSVFEAGQRKSLAWRVNDLNAALLDRLASHTDVHVWDYAGLVSSSGSANWTDPRLWALARTAVSAKNQPRLAAHLMRTLRALVFPGAKCLVLDLDNTLWGGVVGDDGIDGIQLGDDFPGSAFKNFQRAVRGIRDRGILLAVCSRNDPEVVSAVFRQHPEMVLNESDFSSVRVGWGPKSDALREIAAELNIGVDSLVFFDDNPVERAEVRHNLPEVHVVDVPTDPVLYVRSLARIAAFDTPSITSEDRGRARSYESRKKRRQAHARAGNMDDFLSSLEMQALIGPYDAIQAPRIAQLLGKTNQYNVTTHRHSRTDLETMASRDDTEIYWLRLADRYGDMGLIAVAIVQFSGNDATVESFVLSCRAANRGVEAVLIGHLAARATERGCSALIGVYVPTDRNGVVADLYSRLGFTPDSEDEGRFRLGVETVKIDIPDHLEVEVTEHREVIA
jgi:FkbH-like protein